MIGRQINILIKGVNPNLILAEQIELTAFNFCAAWRNYGNIGRSCCYIQYPVIKYTVEQETS